MTVLPPNEKYPNYKLSTQMPLINKDNITILVIYNNGIDRKSTTLSGKIKYELKKREYIYVCVYRERI